MERVSNRRTRSPLRIADAPDSDAALPVEDDGLCTPLIRPHSLEKIRAHNRFARMFATSMRGKWDLSYVGLYAGAGHARVNGDTIVQTSALSVLRQPHPFNHYIFVEKSPSCVEALSVRWKRVAPNANVHIIPKDVNDSIPDIRTKLPSSTSRLLAFCFVDPFSAELPFKTLEALTDLRIDFLILLMLGNDARRNFKAYFDDPTSNRIAELVNRPDWREAYRRDGKPVRFILNAFDEAMQRTGYPTARDTIHPIYADGTKVLQYMLAFYSKNPVGMKLWGECIKSLRRLESQQSFDLK